MLLHLAGAILVKQHEERGIGEDRYLAETRMKLLENQPEEVATVALIAG